MINELYIKNFKCFQENTFILQPVTVLCGVNSGGKSSLIQAFLLAAEAVQNEKEKGNLDLMNSRYNADLYSFDEILNDNAEVDEFCIAFSKNGENIRVIFSSPEGDNNLHYERDTTEGSWTHGKRIWYLGSDRQISSFQHRGNAEYLELGKDNEYIAYILERGRSNKISIDTQRNLWNQENTLFSEQVNQWLEYVLPGSQVMGITTGKDNMVSLAFGSNYSLHRTNVGYGVGFVLPIIVGGLLASKGDLLIVENPEIHLHPKAQSNLSYFLAVAAYSGIQVIIETHSDHIINGLRKAIVNPNCGFKAEQAGIYYLNQKNEVSYLTIDENGYLSDWPEDFMEQVEKDLHYLRKMRIRHDNQHIVE